ncbi:hypothetical protein HMPREF9348_02517 [Escherichia coli MS 145-7]|nr:hypothetical protein HMPREF9348_02517 [Escherichia coli MS 145-7]
MFWSIVYQKLCRKYEMKKYQIDPFFRAKCNSLILFISILKSGKRV